VASTEACAVATLHEFRDSVSRCSPWISITLPAPCAGSAALLSSAASAPSSASLSASPLMTDTTCRRGPAWTARPAPWPGAAPDSAHVGAWRADTAPRGASAPDPRPRRRHVDDAAHGGRRAS